MTKQQFDDLYLGKAVHCNTEEKANTFLELAHSVGYKWSSGRSLLEYNYYSEYREKTCYVVSCDDITFVVLFELEMEKEKTKEKNMKYKVGDKVRVRSDLVVDKRYGNDYLFNCDMALKKGLEATITHVIDDEYYRLANNFWKWTDEMLEPIEETFNVGDVVYDKDGNKGEVTELSYLVLFEHSQGTRYANELSKTKPLQKITRKELADKGYELVE